MFISQFIFNNLIILYNYIIIMENESYSGLALLIMWTLNTFSKVGIKQY